MNVRFPRAAFAARPPSGRGFALIALILAIASIPDGTAKAASSAAVDRLIAQLPNPRQWTTSPLESALKDPDPVLLDPAFRAFVLSLNGHDDAHALQSLRTLARRYPKNPAIHDLRGKFALSLRLYPEAEKAFRATISLKPDAAAGWHDLGICQAAQGHFGDAAASVNQAVRIAPKFAYGWLTLAFLQMQSDKLAKAADSARQATQLAPDYPLAWGVLGLSQSLQGKLSEAITAFHRAVRLQPDYLLALEGLGICLARVNRPAEAIAPLQRAVKQSPGSYLALSQLAFCYLLTGKPAQGEAVCRQAVRAKADFSPAWDALGLCRRQQGKTREALEAFEQAAKVDPGNPAVRAHLAEARNTAARG